MSGFVDAHKIDRIDIRNFFHYEFIPGILGDFAHILNSNFAFMKSGTDVRFGPSIDYQWRILAPVDKRFAISVYVPREKFNRFSAPGSQRISLEEALDMLHERMILAEYKPPVPPIASHNKSLPTIGEHPQ